MSRSIMAILVAAAVITPCRTLSAQDASGFQAILGKWESTMETPRGSFTSTFVFTVEAGELKGTASAQMGESALENVKYEDGKLTFQVVRSFGERSMTQSYSATIEGDMLKGTMSGRRGDREFTATRVET